MSSLVVQDDETKLDNQGFNNVEQNVTATMEDEEKQTMLIRGTLSEEALKTPPSPLASVLRAIPVLWQLLTIPSILQISLSCKDIKNTVDMILLSCNRWKHSSLVLNVRTRKDLAAICYTYKFGGYCIPFKVNDSPNLLKLNYSSGLFQQCIFEMKNQCKWTGFEDTYVMRFRDVEFGEEKLSPPESIANRLRKFLNPLVDPEVLLNKKTLESIGMLLPGNTTYTASWAQLPVYTDTERQQVFEKSMWEMSCLSDPHPNYTDIPVTHHCAGFLYIPGSTFPDPVTRRKFIEWANDKHSEKLWHTPWKRRPKSVCNVWREDDMKSKYGTLGVTFNFFHIRSKRSQEVHDVEETHHLPIFSRESIHWPKLYPIAATEPMDKVNEETVLMYMKLFQEKSNECSRPTVVLLKMKAAAHLDIVYFILDGHHKLIAMQRLVEQQRKESSTSSTFINNRRLNFLIIERVQAWEGNLEDGSAVNVDIPNYRDPHFYDDHSGLVENLSHCQMEKVNGCVNLPMFVVEKALQYKEAMQVLHNGFQVACAVGNLIEKVTRCEHRRLAELRRDKYKIIQKILFLRHELGAFINNSWLPCLPAINWKDNPLLNAGEEHFTKRGKRNRWFEANNPRWYDFTTNELQTMLDVLIDLCKANESLGELLLKLKRLVNVDSSDSKKPPESYEDTLDLSIGKSFNLFDDDY